MSHPELPSSKPSNQPDRESPLLAPVEVVVKAERRVKRWLMRLFHTTWIMLLLLICTVSGLYFWASSTAFEFSVRRKLIAALENDTGGRVEISGFHWDLLHLRLEATGITIHGLEAATEAPYAYVERLRLQVAILGLFTGVSPRLVLREAEILHPAFHLIVYPDGSTNQPHPKHPQQHQPAMDMLFEAEIGHLAIEQGTLHIANEVVPLNLQARNADIKVQWLPAPLTPMKLVRRGTADSYRISVSLADLSFAQAKFEPVSSRIDASIQLFHDSVRLDSLSLHVLDKTLTVRGQLSSFVHPVWQTQASGDIDLRILAPYTGFAFVRSGILHLNTAINGKGADFLSTGDLHSDAIHYQDPVVDAQTAAFSARFRADTHQLLVNDVRIRLARGGDVDGEFQFDNWLESTPPPATQTVLRRDHKTWLVPTGIIRGKLQDVSLDTVLVLLATPPYRHLGLNTLVSGPAEARWTGLAPDLEIGGQLSLMPSQEPAPGETPVRGSVDATYHADSGSIKVRTLDARLAHSSIEGKGSLGVYPITRSSEMDLDFQSNDLSEFDAALQALGLRQGHRTGFTALPVQLKGQAQFHGQLNSSWLTPRVEGHLTATNIGIQVSSAEAAGPVQFTSWDSLDVNGLYTPASIVIQNGVLRRGSASLTLAGHIDSSVPNFNLSHNEPEFDANSILSVKATAQQFPIGDLLPLAGINEPIQGRLNAHVDLEGQVRDLTGSGSVDLDKLEAYGETIDHLHATGTAGNRKITITSLTAQQTPAQNSGHLTATGSYDLDHSTFQVDARGTAIDLAAIQAIQRSAAGVKGKLGFTAAGNGSIRDPHMQAQATVSSITIANQPVADLQLTGSTSQRAITYDLSSHQPAGQFSAHGVTHMDADYTTQANLQFSKFDIGALLKLLKVTGVSGQSDLEGTANLSGPLAHPEKLNGEASLKELAVVVEGVHLKSQGAVHAGLLNGVARLDPVEVTGEDTDLKLHGTLAVTGSQQLDLEANGAVNLRLAESLDPDLIASGVTSFTMQAHGPLVNPILQGKVEFQNASLALQDFPNGLSQIKGSLEFIQNRLEVRSLTAMSGGGQLSVGGYLGFQHGLYADLTATGRSIRIRYPQGISSLADATLHLQGPQNNLLLSGNVQVTRFAINADLDLAAFAANATTVPAIVSPDAPSNHIRFDVHLTSAPQLNFQNAYAKLAGDVDLHLRGTLAAPSLLGRISLTEGSTSIGGTKYDLQRGDIFFNNPVRIQPNIDVDATARVEDYDITLGLHGTPEKLNVTYRSEPPLPEADVIALLALGRTQDESPTYAQQQQQAGDNPTTDALLGGALNATVSNRVQRLFGTGAIKVDPNFIGTIGNSSARVTVVEQIGQNLTFTYASNVNTTTQQLIQAEIAINRHVSLLVTQDESGIFSVVLKNRRRFR